ncbi:She9/mdm33 family containing protein [Rhizoctonia solani 123E]|uniref:She9/mdm33 family containing protein n=1 Tax=Rhizoctonia solani 123E TaxID=1423351 RepID=A0A074RPA7_9AGAM|nr:She9/mdm33 family containing protein [Rhizoctonia solani 123E]
MYKPPGQKNEPSEPISISCRFVATDQWLRTHVDPHWTISELKRHLLAKCVGGVPLVPLGSLGTPGPRLLVPSQSGQITLASLVRPARTAPVRPGGRPSTAPHALLDDRRKPRLSLKVVPSLAKPGTISAPRTVTIHPPTPNIFGIPTGSQAAPSVYFSPRNPVSSPELSPPSFTPGRLEDEPSPPSPNMRLETMSMSSRSTVALGYTQSQPHSHTTSPTFSQGTSPPSRPFSPTLLPQPPESQPLFTPNSEHSMLFSEFASTTPSATGPPPSPYAPTTTRSPPPPNTARSPPLSSSLTSRYEASISNADSSVLELDTQSRSHSPLLSAAEFFRLHEFETEPEPEPSLRTPSPPPDPSPPAFVHRPTGVYPYDPVDVHGISRKRSGSREKNGLEEEFRLVSFALGCIMDEHSTVADLRIRPGELLEIQRKNAIVHLARPTYTQPYFEAPIYMIKRTVTSGQQRPHTSHHHHHQPHIPSRPHQHHIQPHRDYASGHRIPMMPPIQTVEHGFPPQILPISPIESVSSAGARGRSGTVTARDRDPFEMDPELDESHDYAELDMSGLEGIGGGAPLPTGGSGGTTSGWSESSIKPPEERFEWKLRWMVLREGKLSISRSREKPGQLVFARPLSTLLSAQQLPATPQIGSLPRNYIKMHFTGPSRKERGRDAGIGIRMMDGAIHVHLLRVLLRIINTGAHAWLPTDTPIIAFAPLASQYPEWRQYIVQRAWLAGRGASVLHGSTVAGPWMRYPWLAWTDKESELFVDPAPSESDADYETDSSDEHPPALVQTRDSDSEIEWDNEAWRAWESETTFGTWNTSNSSWLRLGSRAEMGRPRSRSLATPSRSSSQQQQQQQMQVQSGSPHHETMLSPVSTSSEVSATSPNTRRARSSTIAGPDSPGNSSPQPWARTGAGIETVLRAPASSEAIPTARRGSNNQTRIVPGERRGSAASMEMQRALPPSRRAVTTPAQASVGKFL